MFIEFTNDSITFTHAECSKDGPFIPVRPALCCAPTAWLGELAPRSVHPQELWPLCAQTASRANGEVIALAVVLSSTGAAGGESGRSHCRRDASLCAMGLGYRRPLAACARGVSAAVGGRVSCRGSCRGVRVEEEALLQKRRQESEGCRPGWVSAGQTSDVPLQLSARMRTRLQHAPGLPFARPARRYTYGALSKADAASDAGDERRSSVESSFHPHYESGDSFGEGLTDFGRGGIPAVAQYTASVSNHSITGRHVGTGHHTSRLATVSWAGDLEMGLPAPDSGTKGKR